MQNLKNTNIEIGSKIQHRKILSCALQGIERNYPRSIEFCDAAIFAK